MHVCVCIFVFLCDHALDMFGRSEDNLRVTVLPSYGSQGLDADCQFCQEAPLSAESSHCLQDLLF